MVDIGRPVARAHADGLAVLHIADGVGLGVLQGDERKDHVVLCALRQILVLGNDVGEQALVNLVVVVTLLKADAEMSRCSIGLGS